MYEGLYDVPGGRIDGVVAPVKGLNTRSALAGLSQDYAIQLQNFICQPDAIITRPGAVDYCTGFVQAPKSLMHYSSATVNKMFAAASDGIFEVVSGVVGAAGIACTQGQGRSVNFATSAGQFLYFVNGVDTPKLYNGTSWLSVTAVSSPAITGLDATTFNHVETYRARLYFLQRDFLGFVYLPADAVGGIANQFRIGSVCRLGGYAVAHGTWSIDGGAGPDDHYVIATSNGEVVVYQGSDPSTVNTWKYVGTYYIGKPLGPGSLVKLGGDLLYLCENGLIPLVTMLQSKTVDYTVALTNNIQPTIANAAAKGGTLPGWKVCAFPRLSLVMINVPKLPIETSAKQFVYNSYSKAWSSFDKWDAADFLEYVNNVYFTTGLKVAKAFTGFADFGKNIVGICDTSYNRFKTRNKLQPLLVRAVFASSNIVSYTIGMAQDFTGAYHENFYASPSGGVSLWNSALWDIGFWSGEFTLRRDWVTITAAGGLAISTRFKVESNTASTLLLAIDYKLSEQGLVS